MVKAYPKGEELGGRIDTTMLVKQPKKMQVEIPGVLNIESDSGNHLLDVASVAFVIVIIYFVRKIFKSN
jgi:hypothetical protein